MLVEVGNTVVNLPRNMLDEYRKKTQYYGPLKAEVERLEVEEDGQIKEVLNTKLMQVKFISKDGARQPLDREELVQVVAKIPGIIPPCDPSHSRVEEKCITEGAENHQYSSIAETVSISFGEGDDVRINKKNIEQFRNLSKVTGSLGAKREKTFRIEGDRRVPVTTVSLFPVERIVNAASAEHQAAVKTEEIRIPRMTMMRGREGGKGKTRYSNCISESATPPAEEKGKVKLELHSDPVEDIFSSELEDGGISNCGFETGLIVHTSPVYNVSMLDISNLNNWTNIKAQDTLPLQHKSSPVDMSARLSSDEIWKYLTKYASEDHNVQGLITQFNNESWLEVKRMSDFFHVDGEVMTDICFKAVYRNDSSPVTYFLRGFSRLIRTGELTTAADISHLFRCLSIDRKLCLGLKPSPYQPDIETSEKVRTYFKQKGHFVSTPFESLFAVACRGIVIVPGQPDSSTFTRGSKSVLGVQALCRACALLGKKLNQLIRTASEDATTSKGGVSNNKVGYCLCWLSV